MKTYKVTVDDYGSIKCWYNEQDQLHNEDGPAVEYKSGTKHWYLNGQRHREDGPAIECVVTGDKSWYINGQRHREDGPAIEYASGDKYWFINGQRHREDGPAIEYASGDKYWYLNGEELTEAEFNTRIKQSSCDGKVVEIDGKKYRLQAL